MGVAPGRHVAASRVDGHHLLTESEAWRQLDREIAAGVLLRLREATHLPRREVDVVPDDGGTSRVRASIVASSSTIGPDQRSSFCA